MHLDLCIQPVSSAPRAPASSPPRDFFVPFVEGEKTLESAMAAPPTRRGPRRAPVRRGSAPSAARGWGPVAMCHAGFTVVWRGVTGESAGGRGDPKTFSSLSQMCVARCVSFGKLLRKKFPFVKKQRGKTETNNARTHKPQKILHMMEYGHVRRERKTRRSRPARWERLPVRWCE